MLTTVCDCLAEGQGPHPSQLRAQCNMLLDFFVHFRLTAPLLKLAILVSSSTSVSCYTDVQMTSGHACQCNSQKLDDFTTNPSG